ncbi:hypothetical protein BGP_1741 [Beggiatoa sp. PS]|nr:hypothetical protein BGP_1741 [Beggiatoa sp. PS]
MTLRLYTLRSLPKISIGLNSPLKNERQRDFFTLNSNFPCLHPSRGIMGVRGIFLPNLKSRMVEFIIQIRSDINFFCSALTKF